MIAKVALGSFAALLFVVLLPLAASLATLLLCIVAAVFWMRTIHALIATLDARESPEKVLAAGRGAVSFGGTRSP